MDEDMKIKNILEWVKQEEEEAGKNADKAYDENKELLFIRYNHTWATYGNVRKYIEKLLKS